jgi:hypothetical protein
MACSVSEKASKDTACGPARTNDALHRAALLAARDAAA